MSHEMVSTTASSHQVPSTARMAASYTQLDALQCEYIIPGQTESSREISRWSDTKIYRPALIVKPATEKDVQAAIRVAKANGVTIVVAGGGHGTFVAVGSNTMYLDMVRFKNIQLDKEHGTVTVGGGVVTGELLRSLAGEGYYTPLPNSNAVGVVGCVLGGGNTPLNGLHGWMADNVVSIRLVASEGPVIELGPHSKGKDAELFGALCGAGHGLGVITAMAVSAYPFSSLEMMEDKVWTRTLIFPEAAINTAAQAFLELLSPLPEANFVLTFMRSPPGTPAAGSPTIILGGTYFGPAEQAEKGSAVMFREDIVGKTLRETTEMVPMANLNNRFEPLNAHGGHKSIASCRLKQTSLDTIKTTFEQWVSVIKDHPDARRSVVAIGAFDSKRQEGHGRDRTGVSKFLEARDRNITATAFASCDEVGTLPVMTGFLDDLMVGFRKGDEHKPPRSFPNNLRFGMSLDELFNRDKLEDLRRVKHVWDPNNVFWCPYKASH
ncbi:putative FAD-binding PCMH-type domain-containing protein [Seiridium unicorne]|uniref:FAD-binding PCMH-type domain-containing protein n=1 Tax=Seiridium unicorne TaxID=138068 RepID=A0ABR2UH22_9PEZI